MRLAAIATGCGGQSPHLRLATTTSVDNSGLLEAILPSFRQETGIEVQVLAVGSGRALELLRRGDADVALTDDPLNEAVFLTKPRSGYKVIFVPFTGGKPSGAPIDVLTGFVRENGDPMGRPVGVAIDTTGAFLVADDVGNVVWRVTAGRR